MFTKEQVIEYLSYHRGEVFTCDELCEGLPEGEFFGITTDSLGNICYTNYEVVINLDDLPDGDYYDISDCIGCIEDPEFNEYFMGDEDEY